MRKINVEYEVFDFEELSDEAKEVAIRDYRKAISDNFESSVDYGNIIDEAEKYGITIEPKDISYTGFWSQGDGASFVSKDIDLSKFLDAVGIQFPNKALRSVIERYANPSIHRVSHRYYHKNTVTASADIQFIEDESYPRLYKAVLEKEAEIDAKLEEVKNLLCDKFYKELRNEYEDRTSDETISEILASSDVLFVKSGKEFSDVVFD